MRHWGWRERRGSRGKREGELLYGYAGERKAGQRKRGRGRKGEIENKITRKKE